MPAAEREEQMIMARSRRPKIGIKPIASHYQASNERIAGISSDVGSCLISARVRGGALLVDVYRADDTVHVLARGTMSADVQESLRRVLAYAIPDEARDYAEQEEMGEDASRHIMTDLGVLAAWLDSHGGGE